jgi:DNA-binding beta-propeller fold protein YncE
VTEDIGGMELDWPASPEVRAVVEGIGRTEDVRFSPTGRRFVVAAFDHGSVLDGAVRITGRGADLAVEVTAAREVHVPDLQRPHGIDFVDERTIAVANREGHITFLRLPDGVTGCPRVLPTSPSAGFDLLDDPGSILVRAGDGAAEVLVCNNSGHTVTRHHVRFEGDEAFVDGSEVLVERWIDLPDGIAASRDGRWLAVSNHRPHVVMVYDRASASGPTSRPQAVLRGMSYPHGLRFSEDGRWIFVADAGSPQVHCFLRDGSRWSGVLGPSSSTRVLDDATFARGRQNPEEGGPKGLDVDPSGRVLALTCEHRPLSFFDVSAMQAAAPPGPEAALDHELEAMESLSRLRVGAADALQRAGAAEAGEAQARTAADRAQQRLVDAERGAAEAAERAQQAEATAAEADARARAAEQHLAALEATKVLRFTAPLRRLYGRGRERRG